MTDTTGALTTVTVSVAGYNTFSGFLAGGTDGDDVNELQMDRFNSPGGGATPWQIDIAGLIPGITTGTGVFRRGLREHFWLKAFQGRKFLSG